MFLKSSAVKDTAKRGVRLWSMTLSLLLLLLALEFVGMSTVIAHTSVPLHYTTVSTQQADSAPALTAAFGAINVGWTGRNAAHNLNLMTYDSATQTFGPAQVLTDTTLAGSGPSLAIFNDQLYVAWMGTDHRLNVGQYNPADPTHLTNKVTLSETSYNAPSIAAFNGRLYLGWQGTDGRLNIISSADASTFNTKITYNITIRTSPSLIAANVYLYIFWEDVSANSFVVVGQYNPSQPTNLSAVVTTNASSQLPVGLTFAGVPEPYVWVAWRTATDAHINLGIYEGDQNLHNTFTTTQTTSYGPALYEPYLAWTGTDTAQSINVSQVNI